MIEIPIIKPDQNEEQLKDFAKIVESCYVDLSEEITKPEILISIGQHEYKNNFYPTPVMTAGEFSAIVAQSKAKKSFLSSLPLLLIGISFSFFLLNFLSL